MPKPVHLARRHWLLVFCLAFITLTIFKSRVHLTTIASALTHTSESRTHPIEVLVQNARKKYDDKLSAQSKTLAAACHEYRARYGFNPPRGFDKWFERAREYEVVFVDEFDSYMESFEPYRSIPPSRLRKDMQQANIKLDLQRLLFRGDKVRSATDHWHPKEIIRSLAFFQDVFPTFTSFEMPVIIDTSSYSDPH